ncbi:MAG: hypothetical protein ACLPVY_13465 [Acidimicrobiia bacterium]
MEKLSSGQLTWTFSVIVPALKLVTTDDAMVVLLDETVGVNPVAA